LHLLCIRRKRPPERHKIYLSFSLYLANAGILPAKRRRVKIPAINAAVKFRHILSRRAVKILKLLPQRAIFCLNFSFANSKAELLRLNLTSCDSKILLRATVKIPSTAATASELPR